MGSGEPCRGLGFNCILSALFSAGQSGVGVASILHKFSIVLFPPNLQTATFRGLTASGTFLAGRVGGQISSLVFITKTNSLGKATCRLPVGRGVELKVPGFLKGPVAVKA